MSGRAFSSHSLRYVQELTLSRVGLTARHGATQISLDWRRKFAAHWCLRMSEPQLWRVHVSCCFCNMLLYKL
jgi:hypothetical protein